MTDPVVTDAPKKPKRKKPAVTRAPRKPRRSLIAIIEAMGPHHLRAYRALSEGDRTWATALSHALQANERVAAAFNAHEAAVLALSQAAAKLEAARLSRIEGDRFRKDLDDLAKQIAHKRGDVPLPEDAPTDADRRGVEIPVTRDMAGNVIPHIDF